MALRPWQPGDIAVMSAWGSDAEIVRWSGVPAGYTEEAARDYTRWLEHVRRDGRMLGLAVVDAGSGLVLGSCDIRRPDPDDPELGEIGYLLAPGARGRGASTRAVGLLIRWAFRELAMRRVQALVHPDNPASAAVLERLGFEREGLLHAYRPGGEDRIIYAVLAGDFA